MECVVKDRLDEFCFWADDAVDEDAVVLRKDAIKIGVEIIEDFESRTCENCKYFIDEKGTKLQFCNARTEGGIIGWNGYGKDFGCNKFESKSNE